MSDVSPEREWFKKSDQDLEMVPTFHPENPR